MRRSLVREFITVAALLLAAAVSLRAQDDVQARMQEWTKALGVDCSHCHIDDQWDLAYLPTFDMAFRMQQMVNDLNGGALKAYGGITCRTCHKGSINPPKITQEQWERDAKRYEAAFNGDNSLALQMGVFTASLGTGCSFCHDPTNWPSDDNPMKTIGRRMRGMVGSINKHFAGVKNPEIGCMTCHQGHVKPER